ncbi:MAG: hypothetical protein EHM89_00040 [Acidobacteria bacterium]|nr:MAG: hypothetical protein EHM89_00040 [Acidobacteriota bacterium]
MRIILIVVLLSACSIAFQSRPPATAGRSASCWSHRVFAIADLVGVAASVAAITTGLVLNDDRSAAIAGPAALTVIAYTASADNGWKWGNRCREMREGVAVAGK